MEDLITKLGANKVTQAIATNHFQQGPVVGLPDALYVDLLDLPSPVPPTTCTSHTPATHSRPLAPPTPTPTHPLPIQPLIGTLAMLHSPEASLLYGASLQKAVDEFKKAFRDFIAGAKSTKSAKESVLRSLSAHTADQAALSNLVKLAAQMCNCNILLSTAAGAVFQGLTAPEKPAHLIVQNEVVLSATLPEVKDYLLTHDLYDNEAIQKLFTAQELRKLASRKGLDTKMLKKDLIAALTKN